MIMGFSLEKAIITANMVVLQNLTDFEKGLNP